MAAVIVFSCSEPVGLEVAAGLPAGARVDNGPDGARVRLALDLQDLAGLLERVVAVGRALPQATVEVEGLQPGRALARPLGAAAVASPTGAAAPASAAAAPPPSSAGGSLNPWELVARRRFDEARAALAGDSLDSVGRDHVRELLHSTDPEEVALACDIAASTRWRSFVTAMKRVLGHADTRVRVAAVRAIGQLAGPAMVWQLQRLSADPSPEVRRAVDEAVAAIEERSA